MKHNMKEFIVDVLYQIKFTIKSGIRWIKHRTISRHHIVDSKLPPGYYDPDTLLLHTSFAILEKFVDEEIKALGKFFPSLGKNSSKVDFLQAMIADAYKDDVQSLRDGKNSFLRQRVLHRREIYKLYKWWTVDRNKRKSDEELLSMDDIMASTKLETQYYEEDTRMLIRLAKIRSSLWV
jgi:hypothetical protein